MPLFKDKYGIIYECDFNFKDCNTLIMSGGAFKCIYFLGSLHKICTKTEFKHYAGTSCGAILATLLSVGYSPLEIFKKLLKIKVTLNITKSLEYTIQIVEEMLEEKNISKKVTFEELYLKTGKEIAFVSSNVSRLREEIFSKYTHPHTSVILAMKLSCSLPIIFPISKYNNDIFIDGIFFDNFPIKLSKLFTGTKKVVCITTSSAHYDRRVTAFYKFPSIYKIIMVPDIYNKYFWVSREDKFCMFVSGYNFVEEYIHKPIRKRSNTL